MMFGKQLKTCATDRSDAAYGTQADVNPTANWQLAYRPRRVRAPSFVFERGPARLRSARSLSSRKSRFCLPLPSTKRFHRAFREQEGEQYICFRTFKNGASHCG